MQEVVRSFYGSLHTIKTVSVLCFSVFVSVARVQAAAAAELYPEDRYLESAPTSFEQFKGTGGRGVNATNFTYFELYRTLGVSYDTSQEVVMATATQLIHQYATAAQAGGAALLRVRFLQRALGILQLHRRDYNTFLFFWLNPTAHADDPRLIPFIDAYQYAGTRRPPAAAPKASPAEAPAVQAPSNDISGPSILGIIGLAIATPFIVVGAFASEKK